MAIVNDLIMEIKIKEDTANVALIPASHAFYIAKKNQEETCNLNRTKQLHDISVEITEAARCHKTDTVFKFPRDGDRQWITSKLEAAGYHVTCYARYFNDAFFSLLISWESRERCKPKTVTNTEIELKKDNLEMFTEE